MSGMSGIKSKYSNYKCARMCTCAKDSIVPAIGTFVKVTFTLLKVTFRKLKVTSTTPKVISTDQV